MTQTKIFVVEDELLVANAMADRLEENGYRVLGISPSGEDALLRLGSVFPDLVLMDIRLDGKLDGIQVAQVVRSEFGLPVVFLTAHIDKETFNRAQLTEPFDYLIKPVPQFHLASSIEMALQKHSLRKLAKETSKDRAALLGSAFAGRSSS